MVNSNIGYVIDWKFHHSNRWVSALTPYLVNAIVKEFNPVIIKNQWDYHIHKKKLKFIIATEPGWSSPKISYDIRQNHIIGVFLSDPHSKKDWFPEYFDKNRLSYVFSYYYHPFFYHMPDFPKDKVIHLPWSIPDEFVSQQELTVNGTRVSIFGGAKSDAYDVRNWCRVQEGVESYQNSGVENKKMTDVEYFKWLSGFDAMIAAGSSDPKYDLVTPKYFEIASAGALLLGQYCRDLEMLGFNSENSVIFTQDTFHQQLKEYYQNPGSFLQIRKNGRELIRNHHLISNRINAIRDLIEKNLN